MNKQDYISVLNEMPISELLKLGKIIAPTEYAVKYYYNPKHKKFYKNKEALLHAIRHGYAQNFADTIKRFEDSIDEYLEGQKK